MGEILMSDQSAQQGSEVEQARHPERLFVLMEGDTFVVADAYGDMGGRNDGLFHNDTRIVSRYRLTVAGRRPSLLSASVSQDNVYFTSHQTNQPLPRLGESTTPEGVIHIERKRFVWKGYVHERILLANYSDLSTEVPLELEFGADFRDMFEVRGQQRSHRGEQEHTQMAERSVTLRYLGLDEQPRRAAISFSEQPVELSEQGAQFRVALEGRGSWELYIDIGPEPAQPSRARYRQAAAQARRSMRRRQRRGAQVKASGRLFQAWLEKSRADLALLTAELPSGPYPYAGVPWYSTPFGRDAIITAHQVLWLNPELARGVLSYLAQHQAHETSSFRDAEPGKIMHETRKGEMSALNELPFGRYYGGVDTTPLFVMLAGAYARRTGDRAFIQEIWPALQEAIRWVEGNAERNAQGFISYARAEESGLANQGWKDSHDSIFHADGRTPDGPISLIEVQGYAYKAYLSMAELSEWLGEQDKAAHWRTRAEHLRAAVEKHFWLEGRQFYALALDGHGEACAVRASNAGHLLFTGLPQLARGQVVSQQLLSRAFNSGWGVRTLVPDAVRFNPMSYHNGSVWPHDVALCAAGMARYGEREGVVRLLGNMFEAAAHFGMRLPELFCGFERAPGEAPIAYPVACLPQAWAAGSVFMLLQACLGVEIDGHTASVTITQPRLPFGIDRIQLKRLRLGEQEIDLTFQRLGERVVAFVDAQYGPQPVRVDIRL